MDIVKAEFLWSRKCPLSCEYCNMKMDKGNTLSVSEWCRGIDQLKELGCGFIAFYGAEPLIEFEKLGPVIQYAEKQGISTTVITSGKVPNFKDKIRELVRYGLKSLTMSYDGVEGNTKESKIKGEDSFDTLCWFQGICPDYRDVGIVATITAKNISERWDYRIHSFTMNNMHFFFDFIHFNHSPYSKCGPVNEDLVLDFDNYYHLLWFLTSVWRAKRNGALIHVSFQYLEFMINSLGSRQYFNPRDVWHCFRNDVTPSWVTVDCDGKVYPCDDFQVDGGFDVRTIADKFDEFAKFASSKVRNCGGCCWNTHFDANLIKAGEHSINDYTRGK